MGGGQFTGRMAKIGDGQGILKGKLGQKLGTINRPHLEEWALSIYDKSHVGVVGKQTLVPHVFF